MVEVYVWLPEGENVGHASLLAQYTYVSWWPDEAVGPKTAGSNFHPIRNKTYESDVRDEGKDPDQVVILQGLDEAAMLEWWGAFGLVVGGKELYGPLPPYNLIRQNCSTVVANVLKAGGGEAYAGWWAKWSVVWRPKTVLAFALSIQQGLLNSAGRTGK